MTDADRPAAEPKNSPSAGAKSPLDIPCRYISGSTSATLGLLRHHGGTMAERNRQSLAGVGVDPAVVDPRRLDLDPARGGGDGAGLGVAVAHHQPPATLARARRPALRCRRRPRLRGRRPASAGRPHGRSRRARPPAPRWRRHRSLLSTSAFLPRRRSTASDYSFWSTRKVRRALERVGDPQVLVITPREPVGDLDDLTCGVSPLSLKPDQAGDPADADRPMTQQAGECRGALVPG